VYISRAPFCRRGRRRGRNSTCKIKRRREREREREKKRERETQTRTHFNLLGNEKCPTESRRIRFSATRTRFTSVAVGRRQRYVVYRILFPLKIFSAQNTKKRERTQNGKKKKKKTTRFNFHFGPSVVTQLFFFSFQFFKFRIKRRDARARVCAEFCHY
jgi:hypothetical protein